MRLKLTFIITFIVILNANNCISSNVESVENQLLSKVLVQLNLNENDIDKELYIEKVLPNEKLFTVMVIPKLSQRDEYYTSYDAYVLVVNNKTAEIANKFVEKDAWTSDAVRMSKIAIDTAPYILSNGNRAFGIRVESVNNSHANPYNVTEFSLFIKKAKTLSCVLKKYPVSEYNGEMGSECLEYSKRIEAVIEISKNATNNFNDIFIKEKITVTQNEGTNGDCKEKEAIENKTIKLTYNGKEYKPL